jgi:hypothetical protein
MHPNGRLIQSFYTAFQACESDGMNACYRSDTCFSDPVCGIPQRSAARAGSFYAEMMCL